MSRYFAIVASVVLAGCASAPTPRPPRDPYGEWHVSRVYSGTRGHEPAREFVVILRRTADAGVLEMDLAGVNAYASASVLIEGEKLTTDGFKSGEHDQSCFRREDIETSNDDVLKPLPPRSERPCWAIMVDEHLISDILDTASGWSEQGETLSVRSHRMDGWVELQR